jgi:hypothetical protein
LNIDRDHPSARYRELLELYRRLHREGERFIGLEPDSTYPGVNLMPHIRRIKALIDETGAKTILDYGCGKGYQYDPQPVRIEGVGTWDSVPDYWDVDEVRCYDPCYERYSRRPEEQFDGVVSTDVLEHCPVEDLPWIVEEIFSYARRFVFASIACYPAKSRLPNGENAHCTVQPPDWWCELFQRTAQRHPGVKWKILLQEVRGGGQRDAGAC